MIERLIDPKTLARVKDMPLIAKTVADGFLQGLQTSQQKGVGIEFSQYRSYEPGDELNHIDWKLFARSDRYYVREAQRTSEITLWLLVDTSASMLQGSEPTGVNGASWDKLSYAKHLAATLAYIGQRQGDSVGLLGLSSGKELSLSSGKELSLSSGKELSLSSGKELSFLPPAGGERHWQRVMAKLSGLKAAGGFADSQSIKPYLARLQQPALMVVISDFYQPNNEIDPLLSQLSNSKNEVVAMQLQSADELNFPHRGVIRFKDLETHEELLVAGKNSKDSYFNALYTHQRKLKEQLAAKNIQLTSLSIDQPMDEGLYHYLKRRQKVLR